MNPGDIELDAARYRLGLQSAASLRALGVRLLSQGYDEALALAIADDLDGEGVAVLFERLCRDLGRPLPSAGDAFELVTAALLRAIAEGRAQPEAGLAELMRDVVGPHLPALGRPGCTYAGEEADLHHLIGIHHQYDDVRERPGDFAGDAISLLDRHVVERAQDWLDARGLGDRASPPSPG